MVEVIRYHKWPLFLLLGLVWFLSNIGAVFWGAYYTSQPSYLPYGEVLIVRDEQIDGNRHFMAHFTKYECDIETLRVLAKYPGAGVTILDWETIEGLPSGNDLTREEYYNRSPGAQTLHLKFPLHADFEWYEVRTTHLCPRAEVPGAERVPLVFAHVDGGI